MTTLYLVATPIGNLDDITLRALRVLGEVSLVACEDTRTTRRLLSHHGITAPRLLSYTEHNKRNRTPAILRALDEGDVALVSEAGMPAISDPGADLVQAALGGGHDVAPIPGGSAVLAAVAVSGLPTRSFYYVGFLPRRTGERRQLLNELAGRRDTIVAFEAPHRVRKTFEDILAVLGDRRIAVCRELTKLYEEVFRGTVSEALDYFENPRGEFTLVIAGAEESITKREADVDIGMELSALRDQGVRARDAVREVSQRSGVPHRDVYQRWLALPPRS